jgi:low affinity Fe/Cu permease
VFDTIACATARYAGRPAVLILAALAICIGFLFFTVDSVNLAISIVSLMLLFVLQNSTNKGDEANQAKLDELIRAINAADNRYIGLDRKPEKEIEQVRATHDPRLKAHYWPP